MVSTKKMLMTLLGGFQPGKMKTEDRWRSQEEGGETRTEPERPKKVLRSIDTVRTQEPVGGHSSYKMPPGTSKIKRTQEHKESAT